MKLGAKSLGFTIAATLLAAMGVAVAQQTAAPPPPVEVSGQQDVALSPQQMLTEAKGVLARDGSRSERRSPATRCGS